MLKRETRLLLLEGVVQAMSNKPSSKMGRPRLLTDEQALEIRSRYKGRGKGPTFQELANEYGMTRESITSLIKGHTYRHLPVAEKVQAKTILTEEEAIEIILAYKGRGKGPSYGDLARRYCVNRMVVRSIIFGKTFKHLDREQLKASETPVMKAQA